MARCQDHVHAKVLRTMEAQECVLDSRPYRLGLDCLPSLRHALKPRACSLRPSPASLNLGSEKDMTTRLHARPHEVNGCL